MKAQPQTLQNKMTEDQELELFAPLSEHATEPAIKRVDNVMTLLASADKLAREQREQMRLLERSGKDWHHSKPFMESLRTSAHTWEQLNAELMRYPWLALSQGGPGKFWLSERSVTKSTGRWAAWERCAVGTLLSLAKKPRGLYLLRRCLECNQWFYARRPHQQFCGEPCRRRRDSQDPEFKEKRAKYMREVYRAVVVPESEARSKRQAARVLSEKPNKGGK